MRQLDLFSGIGGFALAASWVWGREHEVIAFCDNNKFCRQILNKHWPDVPIFDNIQKIRGDEFDSVDLLTGGFPCQPFSIVGKQKGRQDDRFLWPEMLRIVAQARPTWVIGENVAGIIPMALDNCIADLEAEDYSTRTFVIPACAVGAPHQRDRIWIIANTNYPGPQGRNGLRFPSSGDSQDVANPTCHLFQGSVEARAQKFSHPANSNWWAVEPNVDRVAHGVPGRVDRLKALGNAIVPQVAYEIMYAIKEVSS